MKRIATALLAVLLVAMVFAGCNNDNNNSSGASNVATELDGTLEDLFGKINSEFGEYGAVVMPTTLDETTLNEQYGLTSDEVAEYYGEYSMSMTNSDHLIAIKAKPGKVDEVVAALEARKQYLVDNFETYPVNGSFERAQTAEIYTRGDYVFLIMVGHMPDNLDDGFDFTGDVRKVRDVIDSMFK